MLLAADARARRRADAALRRARASRRRGRRRSRPARARRPRARPRWSAPASSPRCRSCARRAARRAASRVVAATTNSAWPWNRISSAASSGSSAKTGATSFLPGMSAAVSTATTPGAARTAARSSARSVPQRLVGHADRQVQRALRLADVVDVSRRAADVQARRIVGMRLVDDRRRVVRLVDGNGSLTRARQRSLRCGSAFSSPATSISAFFKRLAATSAR